MYRHATRDCSTPCCCGGGGGGFYIGQLLLIGSRTPTRWDVHCVLVGPFPPPSSTPHEIFMPRVSASISQSGFGLSGFHAGYLHPRHHEPRRHARRLCLGASLTDHGGESCEPLHIEKIGRNLSYRTLGLQETDTIRVWRSSKTRGRSIPSTVSRPR